MKLNDQIFITYEEAQQYNEANLKRLLLWSLKNNPSAERIKRENTNNKESIIVALAWMGVISS